jgi:putative inorganic carbon (hco3(-)) transporter
VSVPPSQAWIAQRGMAANPGLVAARGRQSTGRMGRVVTTARRLDLQQRLVYLLWFIQLFSPHWLIADKTGIEQVLRIPLLFVLLLAGTLVFKPKRADLILSVLLWIVMLGLSIPIAVNRQGAIEMFRYLASFYILGLATVRAIETPQQARPLIFMVCVGQFLWWGALGMAAGKVGWHPSLANPDGFGPAMAIGFGPAYFYATAVQNPKRKILGYLAAALCAIGVVSAFARGAVFCLLLVVGYVWLRSPRKGRTFGFIAIAAVAFGIASTFIDGKSRDASAQSSFMAEMMTSFNENDGTGSDRKILWGLAIQVFKAHPVLGAGPEGFGVGAIELFERNELGPVGGDYAANPHRLWGRALHNIYYQVLSENGLVGAVLFIYMMFVFWKQSRALRNPVATQRWYAAGGIENVRQIGVGLESALVGFLSTGYFYNQMRDVWLWFFIFTNTFLFYIIFARLGGAAGSNAPHAPASSTRRTSATLTRAT